METKPEVSFANLFQEPAEQALDLLDTHEVVLAIGPAGIGKSEVFLGKDVAVNRGGLRKLLQERSRVFSDFDFSIAGVNPELRHKQFTLDSSDLSKPEVVLIDEGAKMISDPELANHVVGFLQSGKKIVICGGGRFTSSAQISLISQTLEKKRVAVGVSQAILLKPTILTPEQSVDLLLARGGKMTPEIAAGIVYKYQEEQIPLMFRSVYVGAPKPFTNRDESVDEVLNRLDRWQIYSSAASGVVDQRRDK